MPATDAILCAHCGLPVPDAPPAAGAAAFCCAGCATAWSLLHDHGLAHYYRLPERRRAAVAASGRRYDELDHPAFQDRHVRRGPDGVRETELYLDGVHCASCVWLVERVPLAVPGAVRAELDVSRHVVRLAWDERATTLAAIARFLDELGYRAHPWRAGGAETLRRAEDRAALLNIGVAGALAGNVMMFALALYAGWLGGIERELEHYFRWISLALTTPALFGPGRVFFRGAWAALRTRALHLDLPIAIALAVGWARGAVNTVRGTGPIYFDGVAALVFLLLVGRFLQQRAQRAAADSGALLYALTPATARAVSGDRAAEVPVDALLPGMEVEVRSGETVPADGVVVDGAGELDTALLTGESRPVAVTPGDAAHAGTVNLGGRLRIRVERAGSETRVGRMLAEVERGAMRRAPIVRAADRLAGGFVAVVLALAAATWLWWAPRDPANALDHAIALLIVTCPCALALGTPLAVTVAIGRAARRGILVRGGDALETLARPGLLLLDKTGTVTTGRTRLIAWHGPDEVRALVLALERHSSHPIAAAFARAWPELHVLEAAGVVPTFGGGLRGVVGGRRVVVGSPAFVAAHASGAPPVATAEDRTPVHVAVDGRVVAVAELGDTVRPEAALVLARLRGAGWRLRLLSGDAPAVAHAIGATLGFAPEECRGGATPEDKLAAVAEAARRGPVVMVGDGVNDAAAISHATAGIGVRGGAEACLAAADVFLAREGLEPLGELVAGARRTMRVIRRTIAFSLAYNAVGATLAVTGAINPLIAAILMPLSSLTVVLAAWRGRTFDVPVTPRAAGDAGREVATPAPPPLAEAAS